MPNWLRRIFSRPAPPPPPASPGFTSFTSLPPDQPRPFGYKTSWLAVRSSDTAAVAAALRLRRVKPATWAAAHSKDVFLTPPIEGWTLVNGWGLELLRDSSLDAVGAVVASLSERFGEAQFFLSFRTVGMYGWLRAEAGTVSRSYISGEAGVMAQGPQTPIETALGLSDEAPFTDDADWQSILHADYEEQPDEEWVLRVAEDWSISPESLETRNDVPREGCLIGDIH